MVHKKVIIKFSAHDYILGYLSGTEAVRKSNKNTNVVENRQCQSMQTYSHHANDKANTIVLT